MKGNIKQQQQQQLMMQADFSSSPQLLGLSSLSKNKPASQSVHQGKFPQKQTNLQLPLSSIYSLQQSQLYIQPQTTQAQSSSQLPRGFSSKKKEQNYQYQVPNTNTIELQTNGGNNISKYFPSQSSSTALMQELIAAAKQQHGYQKQQLQNRKQPSQSFSLQKETQREEQQALQFLQGPLTPISSNTMVFKQPRIPSHRKSNSSSSPSFPHSQNQSLLPSPKHRDKIQVPTVEFLSTLQKKEQKDRISSSSVNSQRQSKVSNSSAIKIPVLQPPSPQNQMTRPSTSEQMYQNKGQSVLKQFITKIDQEELMFGNGNQNSVSPYIISPSPQNQPLYQLAIVSNSKSQTPHHGKNGKIKQIQIDSQRNEESSSPFLVINKESPTYKNYSNLSQESSKQQRSSSSPAIKSLKSGLIKCEELLLKKIEQIDKSQNASLKAYVLQNKQQKSERLEKPKSSGSKLSSTYQNKPFSFDFEKSQNNRSNDNDAPLPLSERQMQSDNKMSEKIQANMQPQNSYIANNKQSQLSQIVTQQPQEQSQQQYDFRQINPNQDQTNDINQIMNPKGNNDSRRKSQTSKQTTPRQLTRSRSYHQFGKKHPELTYYLAELFKAFKTPYPTDQSSILLRQHFLQSCQGVLYSNVARPLNPKDLVNKKVTLGPLQKKYKKTLIFDMDETLIHCNENLSIPCDIVVDIKFPTGEFIQAGVNIRPFAKEILQEMSEDFEIVIFTASHSCYAQSVISQLDPEKKYVHHRFFREQCIQTPQGVYIKDLRIFSDRSLQDIVLIDNAAYSFCFQIDNGIPILPFYNNKQDTELIHLASYLHNLNSATDVREYNRTHLKMSLYNNSEGPSAVFNSIFNVNI